VRFTNGIFQVVNGVIYGGTGANANEGTGYNALHMSAGTATLGTMVGGTFTQIPGQTLASDNDTIRVVNGVRQPN